MTRIMDFCIFCNASQVFEDGKCLVCHMKGRGFPSKKERCKTCGSLLVYDWGDGMCIHCKRDETLHRKSKNTVTTTQKTLDTLMEASYEAINFGWKHHVQVCKWIEEIKKAKDVPMSNKIDIKGGLDVNNYLHRKVKTGDKIGKYIACVGGKDEQA
jgi:hypothetical protein